jgi:subtilisin family serine protease
MSTPTHGSGDPYQRFWEQLDEVNHQHAKLVPPVTYLVEPAEATRGSGIAPRYVYEARAVLVRAADMDQVRLHTAAPDQDVPGVPGVRKLMLDEGVHVPTEVDRLNQAVRAAEPDAPAATAAVDGVGEHDAAGGPGGHPAQPMASPNHLVTIAPVNLCPAGEPHPVTPGTPLWPPYPQPQHETPGVSGTPGTPAAGTGVSVLIIDTGLQADFAAGQAALAGVQTVLGESQRVPVDPETDLIKEYAGHGTFIAGVLRSVAPGTDVAVSSALQYAGALAEDALASTILTALEALGQWPDIISLSAGTPSHRHRTLMSLEPLFEQLHAHPGTVLVAAAGNDGTHKHPFFPAASARSHPGIISVGALRRDGQGRACFSNYGDWVKVYAPGEQIINVFRHGTYGYHHESTQVCRYRTPPLYHPCGCVDPVTSVEEEVSFDGLASWNGTSFATPLVAGLIAAHMTETKNSDARAAAHDLLRRHATTIEDAGDREKLLTLR